MILVLGLLFIIKLELVKVREIDKGYIEFINIIKTNFKILLERFFNNFVPIMLPIIPPIAHFIAKFQSIKSFLEYIIPDVITIGRIQNIVVALASFSSNLSKCTKIGTSISPPPAPKRPDIIPELIPIIIFLNIKITHSFISVWFFWKNIQYNLKLIRSYKI